MVDRLTVSYNGERYAGWQRQPNAVTVQQVLEEALTRLRRSETRIVGAGRTDAGVHARAQVAHLVPDRGSVLPLRALVHGTNRFLPDDVRVMAAGRAPDGFDARRSAAAKVYSYRIVRGEVESALERPFSLGVPFSVDVVAMRRAARALVGRHDFSAFALAGGSHDDPRREIFASELVEDGARLIFTVRGEGFLRGMVRSLVGTLLEVGRSRLTVSEFSALLEGGSRAEAGPTAAARGLVLERVEYASRWKPVEVYDGREYARNVVD